HRRSCPNYSPAGERSGNRSFGRGIDHHGIDHHDIDHHDPDDPNGHLYGHDHDHATGPEHWNWRLLIFRTVGRKPVNIHQFFYSSKLVSFVLNLPAAHFATTMPLEM